MMQFAGTAFQLSAPDLGFAMSERPNFRRLLMQYTAAFNMQIAFTAACNARHLISQRIARRLLMADDRCDGGEFPMSQELLSMMLGVRRASVSVAVDFLRKSGLIHYRHAHIHITDRQGMEAAACGCYAASNNEYNGLVSNRAASKANEGDSRAGQVRLASTFRPL